jgi:hypothetical protein
MDWGCVLYGLGALLVRQIGSIMDECIEAYGI